MRLMFIRNISLQRNIQNQTWRIQVHLPKSSPQPIRSYSSLIIRNNCNTLFGRNNLKFKNFEKYLSSSSATNNSTIEHVIDLTTTESKPVTSSINTVLENIVDKNEVSNAVIETSVAQLNLASNWTPVGWCIHYLDFLHSLFPWWGAIMAGTFILRLCMIPMVISSQRSAAKLNELLPQQALLKERMNKARISGDSMEFARLSQESMTMYKRHGVNPFKAMLTPIAQAPVFITFFITLRDMASHPVESLKDGGILWFTDLSIPDSFYALPIICATTLWLTLETSFRSGLNPNQTPLIKYGARIVPIITLAFTFNFQTSIMIYWCTNNFISLCQVLLLKIPAVRQFLNLPQIKYNSKQLQVNKKSFKQHFRETMDNAKINRLMEERKTLDEINFKKAGVGPLQRTYKEPPKQNR